MKLNTWLAKAQREILDDVLESREPSQGEFDPNILKEARVIGNPQLGTLQYFPNSVTIEIVFSKPGVTAIILPVKLDAPQRIVFLPVPDWVVESIWQGEIAGSYHFESDALAMVQEFTQLLDIERNSALFGPQRAKRRE